MKLINFLLLFCIVCITINCNKKNDAIKMQNGQLQVKELYYSDCKNSLKSTNEAEYVQYSCIDSNYLFIQHVNVRLNCCPDSFIVKSNMVGDKINYNVCQNEPKCNCNCLYDLSFKIGPLAYGNYSISLNVCTGSTAEFFLDFKNGLNQKYDLYKNEK